MEETLLLPLRIEPQELVYQDPARKIYKVLARFDGFHKEYYVADTGPRAAVVVVRQQQVLLVKQYRLLLNDLSYEIPGGKPEEGEAPEATAIRECLEETGVQCRNLKPLVNYHPGLDTLRNYTSVFYSEEAQEMDHHDPARRVWMPLAQCIGMIFSQQILDSLSIIALLAYHTKPDGRRP